MKSPLRYPGGKAKLEAFFRDLIIQNGLEGVEYAEPFAGGAGLALSLLHSGHVSHVHLNDVDPFITAFWTCVLEETEAFSARVLETAPTMAEWRHQQSVLRDPEHRSVMDLGFCAFFLNRTNRSGIIKGAGAIGGLAQSGKFKVSSRYYAETMVGRIQAIGAMREKITSTGLDAIDFCRRHAARDDILLYLDPPYYGKGARLYKNYYTHSDHVELRDLVSNELSRNWIVSYDSDPEILELYKGHTYLRYGLPYTAATKRSGTEAIFFASNIDVPPLRAPMTPATV